MAHDYEKKYLHEAFENENQRTVDVKEKQTRQKNNRLLEIKLYL